MCFILKDWKKKKNGQKPLYVMHRTEKAHIFNYLCMIKIYDIYSNLHLAALST